ncbi:YSC84-related protein [Thiorhodovibrio winogradskyi]
MFRDEDANRAYYGREVTAAEIIKGEVEDPMSPSPLLSSEMP